MENSEEDKERTQPMVEESPSPADSVSRSKRTSISIRKWFTTKQTGNAFSLKLWIALIGYKAVSYLLNFLFVERVAESLAVFALMLGIYWIPPRLKVNFINWAGVSSLLSITIFAIDLRPLNWLSILLILAYFLSRSEYKKTI